MARCSTFHIHSILLCPPCSCPGYPRISSVVQAASGAVEVEVVPPLNDFGSPITSYEVVAVPAAGGVNLTVGGTLGGPVAGTIRVSTAQAT